MIARSGSTGNECSGIDGTPNTSISGKCSNAAHRDARNTPCWTMTAILIAFAMPPHHAVRHAPVVRQVPTAVDLTGCEASTSAHHLTTLPTRGSIRRGTYFPGRLWPQMAGMGPFLLGLIEA